MEHIDISIIVSVWNRDKFLVDALQSIIDQDFGGKTQVVLCDDGWLDATTKVIENYQSKFDKFDVIRANPSIDERLKTSRLAIMINRAIPLCVGRYISYLPDDDLYRPERNRMMVEFLDKNLDIYFVYHWMKLILVSQDKAVVGEASDLCDPWDESMEYWVKKIYNRIDHTSFVHRNLGKKNVLWDENPFYKRCVDWGFILQILNKPNRYDFKIDCLQKYLAIGRKIQGESLNLDGDKMIEKMSKDGAK